MRENGDRRSNRWGLPGRVAGADPALDREGAVVTPRVLIVDDQRVVRDGLTALLEAVDGLELVGAPENGAHALQLAEQRNPDVVLMDQRMPVMDGV